MPEKTAFGGTTTYYQAIHDLFTFNIKYISRGEKYYPYRKNVFVELYRLLSDFLKYILIINRYKLIHFNSSIRMKSLIRDSFYILIARMLRKKTIITFHAWDENLEHRINHHFLKLFKLFFLNVDSIIVLSNDFRSKIIKWGYKKPVYVESTIIDRELLVNVNKQKILSKYNSDKKIKNILFLSRIEKMKGIYEALKTFELLKVKLPNLKLTIAGDGIETAHVKKYIKEKELTDIEFLGYVKDCDLSQAYIQADLYFFPSYTEGMPTTVLEAMAFGLPVVTRAVGGLKDFFQDELMGYITESKDPSVFSHLIEKLLLNPIKMKSMGVYNHKYALNNFIAEIVIKRIEKIYSTLLNS